eukprot:jgi/Ulvmu1/11598/UM079_0043.1
MARGKACPKKEQLRQSRAMQGVEWLESSGQAQRTERSSGGGQSRSRPRTQGGNNQRTPGFQLRDTAMSGPHPPDLVQLEDMFGVVVQHRIIGQVYDQHQPDLDACVDALIRISEGADVEPNGDVATCSAAVDQASFPGLLDNGPKRSTGQGNLWDTLPHECQVLITDMLTVRDLAVASLVCTSMALSAALVLDRVDVVRCRCSIRSIAGMLRRHRNASKLVLTQMAPRLRHIVAFEELAKALRLAAGLHAGRSVPISQLEFRQSSTLDADALHELLHALPSLHSFDLSQSADLGDDVLRMLALHSVVEHEPELQDALDAIACAGSGHSAAAIGAPGQDGSRFFARSGGRDLSFTNGVRLGPAVATLLDERRHPQRRRNDDSDRHLPIEEEQRDERVRSPPSASTLAPLLHSRTSGNHSSRDNLSRTEIRQGGGISSLVVRNCRVTEAGVRALFAASAQCAKSLTVLDVSGCTGISLAFLSGLPSGSPLAVLKADGCTNVRSVSASLPEHSALRELSLRRCPNLVSLSLTAPALQECNVSQSKQLGRVTLTAPALQRMRAVHCHNLAAFALGQVPRLVELNLMGASALPGAQIVTALAASTALQACNLVDCLLLASLTVPGPPHPLLAAGLLHAMHTVLVPHASAVERSPAEACRARRFASMRVAVNGVYCATCM